MGEWTLLSNHGHVLVCLAKNNEARLRDVAAAVGITERAVQNILREMQDSGMVSVSKHGRCNHYQINLRKSLRHPLEAHCTVGKLLQLLKITEEEQSPTKAKPEPAAAKPVKAADSAVRSPKAPTAAPAVTPVHKPPPVSTAVISTDAASAPVEAGKAKHAAEPEAETKTEAHKKPKAKTDPDTPPSSQQGSLF